MLNTVALPRKWSTRWMWSSGTKAARVLLSSRADSELDPKGFSITRLVPAGSCLGGEDLAGLLADVRWQREIDGDWCFEPGQERRELAVRRDIHLMVFGTFLQGGDCLLACGTCTLGGLLEGAAHAFGPLLGRPRVGTGSDKLQAVRESAGHEPGKAR